MFAIRRRVTILLKSVVLSTTMLASDLDHWRGRGGAVHATTFVEGALVCGGRQAWGLDVQGLERRREGVCIGGILFPPPEFTLKL